MEGESQVPREESLGEDDAPVRRFWGCRVRAQLRESSGGTRPAGGRRGEAGAGGRRGLGEAGRVRAAPQAPRSRGRLFICFVRAPNKV